MNTKSTSVVAGRPLRALAWLACAALAWPAAALAALPSTEHGGQPWKLWVALASGTALAWLLMRLVQPPPPPVHGRRPDFADLAEARTLLRAQSPAERRAWQDTVVGWEDVPDDGLRQGPPAAAGSVSTASAPARPAGSPPHAR